MLFKFHRHKIPENLVRDVDLGAPPSKFLIEWVWEKAQKCMSPVSYQVILLLLVQGPQLEQCCIKGDGRASPSSSLGVDKSVSVILTCCAVVAISQSVGISGAQLWCNHRSENSQQASCDEVSL